MPNSKAFRSLHHIHAKILGKPFSGTSFGEIISDIKNEKYGPEHIAAFLTACAAQELEGDEIYRLTKAMVQSGETMIWQQSPVLDKHCVGGLPGNRTTPIVVAIVAAAGLTIPKTSSRAITSAAGTADTMEVFAPVDLDIDGMRRVVEKEGGCIIWGGNVGLSPVDDDLVHIARSLEFDGTGQMVASVLSKKIAAGASHVVIDIPAGPTAKIKNEDEAHQLAALMTETAKNFGLTAIIKCTDGTQPIGDGIGPALEARDVWAVLNNRASAPDDLKTKSLALAGSLLEIGGKARVGEGVATALQILQKGKALKKFQAICEAQGGLRELPTAKITHAVLAPHTGSISSIDNGLISKLAKAAGAPEDKAAGLDIHVRSGDPVFRDQPIFTIHAQSHARLEKTLAMIEIDEPAIYVMDTEEKIRRCM